jgi:hypothetical protein
LRDIGTAGAGLVFASDKFRELRADIARAYAHDSGDLEVLLRVEHDSQRTKVKFVRVVSRADGEEIAPVSSGQPSSMINPALTRVFNSLKTAPRPIRITNFRYELVVTQDYSARIIEEKTLVPDETDVTMLGEWYGGDPPLESIDDLEFTAEVTNSIGTVEAVVALNSETRKQFLLFPIPPATVGGPAPRIRTSARWPRGASRLEKSGGHDEFAFSIPERAKGSIDTVEVTLRFEVPDGVFRVTEHFAGGTLSEHSLPAPYRREFKNVVGGTKFAFFIERK